MSEEQIVFVKKDSEITIKNNNKLNKGRIKIKNLPICDRGGTG